MSFPSPQAKMIHWGITKEILLTAETEGVVLESDDDFKAYRDAFVEEHFIDPASPRYKMAWHRGIGARANFNRNSMKYWRADDREQLVEEEKQSLREREQRIWKRNREISERSALADGAVAELLAMDLSQHTSETVYQFICDFWRREVDCDSDFEKSNAFKEFGRYAFDKLNRALK